jgi:hypothetical protein
MVVSISEQSSLPEAEKIFGNEFMESNEYFGRQDSLLFIHSLLIKYQGGEGGIENYPLHYKI